MQSSVTFDYFGFAKLLPPDRTAGSDISLPTF
jgi:hypothetical protein